ncbi:MAG TPA: hypothetical protein VMF89_03935, partial [Polyangiales bacterium]|nr:hypothetical protein [Polyangiales bacterium]
MTFFLERTLKEASELGAIFDDQQLHRGVSTWSYTGCRFTPLCSDKMKENSSRAHAAGARSHHIEKPMFGLRFPRFAALTMA